MTEPKTCWKVTAYCIYLKAEVIQDPNVPRGLILAAPHVPAECVSMNPAWLILNYKKETFHIPWVNIICVEGIKEEVEIEVEPDW